MRSEWVREEKGENVLEVGERFLLFYIFVDRSARFACCDGAEMVMLSYAYFVKSVFTP